MNDVIFPIQPLHIDEHDVQRFVPNKIVQALLDTSTLDLNQLAMMDFTDEERIQFAQLIGYSVDGFGSLSYVSDEAYESVVLMGDTDFDENDARITFLRQQLDVARQGVRLTVAALFKNHPDDLEV